MEPFILKLGYACGKLISEYSQRFCKLMAPLCQIGTKLNGGHLWALLRDD